MHAIDLVQNARSDSRDDDVLWRDFRAAIDVLRARIHGNGASDLVLAELVEDDLRQARISLRALEAFLDGAVETLGRRDAAPADVVDVADTSEALDACERLESLLPSIRRRLGQVALRLARR